MDFKEVIELIKDDIEAFLKENRGKVLTFTQLQQRLNEGCLGGMSVVCFISLSHEFSQVRRNYQRMNGQIVSLFQITD